MTNQEMNIKVAIEIASYEYFSNCINNGATPAQAAKEMEAPDAQMIIAKKALQMIEG